MAPVLFFIKLKEQIRIIHWQTKIYSKHQALGLTYDELNELIDSYVEICIGKHGRFKIEGGAVEFKNIDELDMNSFLDESIKFLVSLTNTLDTQMDSDLLNIRDEIMAHLNKLKYLLTLK